MSTSLIISIMIVLVIMLIVFIWFFITGKKEDYMLEGINQDPIRCMYLFGLGVLSTFQYGYQSSYDRKMLRSCKIVYGEKYADYHMRMLLVKQLTWVYLLIFLSLVFTEITNEIIFAPLGIGVAGGIAYYFFTTVEDEIKVRKEEIELEFAEVLSKLALLVNAGMILREAWAKVAATGSGTLYKEMGIAIDNMDNGMAEVDAYIVFADRCANPQVNKFASTLVQNMTKGNRELVIFLKQFSQECWEDRKQNARKKGEEASGKLLIPVVIMFAGLLIMLLVPIMSGLSI